MQRRSPTMFLARLASGASALAFGAVAALSAQAQDAATPEPAPEQPVPASTPTPDEGIQDIVVTAQKKSENLRDVPIAITAVTGEQLAASNIARLSDITSIVPGFTLSLAALQPITFVRGFGTTGSFSFEQAVGKFVDTVSYGRDFDGRLPLFDLERLEVLKGPQVLLFGNSATAGALNITTRSPGKQFEANGSIGYEFENHEVVAQGGVTVPISDAVSLRVAGLVQRLERGWIHNDLTGEDEPRVRNAAARAILVARPTPSLTIRLKAEVDRLREKGSVAQPIKQSVLPSAAFTEFRLDDHRSVDFSGAPFFMDEYNRIDAETYQGDVSVDLGPGTVTSTTAYRVAHSGNAQGNGSQRSIVILTGDQRYTQLSQELRYGGKVGRADFVLGAYYERNTSDIVSVGNFNLSAIGSSVPQFARINTYDQVVRTYSTFGQLTYHLTDALSVSAGLRYSIIRKSTDQALLAGKLIPGIDFDTSRSEIEAAANPAFNGLIRAVLGGTPHAFTAIPTREEHAQPQAVIQYELAPRTMAFLKFVKGDKAGGVDYAYAGNATAALPEQAKFAPERAESFEAGIKGLTLGRTLDYALTLYNTTFSNLQTSVFLGPTLFVTNVGKARSRGIELEAHYAPVAGLRLDASGAVQDAKYLSYPNASCTVAQTPLPPAPALPCTQDLSGARTPFNSRFAATLGANYERPVGDYVIAGGATMVYKSRYNTTTNNDPLGDQAPVATVDAHLDLRPDGGWWGLSLFGRNLSDQLYKEYSVATPLVRGGFNTFVARDRQIGLRFDAHF